MNLSTGKEKEFDNVPQCLEAGGPKAGQTRTQRRQKTDSCRPVETLNGTQQEYFLCNVRIHKLCGNTQEPLLERVHQIKLSGRTVHTKLHL